MIKHVKTITNFSYKAILLGQTCHRINCNMARKSDLPEQVLYKRHL